ncbi:hypothetical protein B0A48_03792 [Cryoendolithus antarcticus]|uniref:BTB domain-containing protein n=1 Tax=Cryoendolithus antarcticus TaxID=1507870 RepID=A0A1V8TGJ4_9PEZI|nr:hypothetical protein B0A48_03792 [Cryoendolithus antarcticus]
MDADTTSQAPPASTHTSPGPQEQAAPLFFDLIEMAYGPNDKIDDVILVVKDYHVGTAITIRASIYVLAAASKVFRALFSDRYAEGQSLSAGRKEVHLEDPPKSLLILCQLLHHLPVYEVEFFDGTDGVLLIEGLVGFASVIDKYDCVHHLHLSSYALLHKTLHEYNARTAFQVKEGVAFAAAAYILNHSRLFKDMTRELVHEQSGNFRKQDPDVLQYLPDRFMEIVESQRMYIEREINSIITILVEEVITEACKTSKTHIIVLFLENLENHGFWPLTHTPLPAAEVIYMLPKIDIPMLLAEADRAGASQSPKAALAISVKHLKLICKGLCLDCLKDNGLCRVQHLRESVNPAGISMADWGMKVTAEEQAAADSAARLHDG